MITRAEVDAAAASWARNEAMSSRTQHDATVEEFDEGFVVRVRPAQEVPGPVRLGDGVLVVDRQTGRVSTWPSWPSTTLHGIYREQRGQLTDAPRTSDPAVQLRRESHRLVTPSIAAHATVDGRVHVARGAKGDQVLNHHPLVRTLLAGLPPQEQVRGCERHAELIVCSDVLHHVDHQRSRAGMTLLTLDEARTLLSASLFETFQIQASGDPLAGSPNDPCETCTYVLTQLALMPWSSTGVLHPSIAPAWPNPEPGQLSDLLAAELRQSGWIPRVPSPPDDDLYEPEIDDVVAVPGAAHRHEPFPAAYAAIGRTGLVGVARRAPGVDQRCRPFEIVPTKAAHTADLLAEFGRVINSRLFPIGRVNGESVLAIDEHGRVFDLDQAGEWFVGDTYLDGLETLAQGRLTYRVRDDGTWGPQTS